MFEMSATDNQGDLHRGSSEGVVRAGEGGGGGVGCNPLVRLLILLWPEEIVVIVLRVGRIVGSIVFAVGGRRQ